MKSLLFSFSDLDGGKAESKLTSAFKRAGAEVIDTAVSGAKRSSGVSFRDITLTFADSQTVTVSIKQSGDMFAIKVNGSLLPIKEQDNHPKAITEVVKAMDAGRAAFQKKQALVKVALPKTIKSAAPKIEATLKTKLSELEAQIADTSEMLGRLKDELALDSAALDSAIITFDKKKGYFMVGGMNGRSVAVLETEGDKKYATVHNLKAVPEKDRDAALAEIKKKAASLGDGYEVRIKALDAVPVATIDLPMGSESNSSVQLSIDADAVMAVTAIADFEAGAENEGEAIDHPDQGSIFDDADAPDYQARSADAVKAGEDAMQAVLSAPGESLVDAVKPWRPVTVAKPVPEPVSALDAASEKYTGFSVDCPFGKHTVIVKSGSSDKESRTDAISAVLSEMGANMRVGQEAFPVSKIPKDAWEAKGAKGWAWIVKGQITPAMDGARKFNQKTYAFYIVADGKIESGWDYREDAVDHKKEGLPDKLKATAKIVAKVSLKGHGLNPDDNASWMTTSAAMDAVDHNWHTRTMDGMKLKSESTLRYIIKDATEAAEIGEKMENPNPKSGQYRDEAHYALMEIQRRKKMGLDGALAGIKKEIAKTNNGKLIISRISDDFRWAVADLIEAKKLKKADFAGDKAVTMALDAAGGLTGTFLRGHKGKVFYRESDKRKDMRFIPLFDEKSKPLMEDGEQLEAHADNFCDTQAAADAASAKVKAGLTKMGFDVSKVKK